MYFSKVNVLPQFLSRKELLKLFDGNNYAEHQLLWRLFDDDKRQYLFRRESGDHRPDIAVGSNNHLPVYYVLSKHPPEACSGLLVQTKSFDPQLAVGMKLGFSLRANPTVAKKIEGKKNRLNCDLMAKARETAREQALSGPELAALQDEAAIKWLAGRAEPSGFSMIDGHLHWDNYRRNRFYKAKGGEAITVSSVDYSGILRIEDLEAFEQALFNGIGRAKAFGCGMLMIRRV